MQKSHSSVKFHTVRKFTS